MKEYLENKLVCSKRMIQIFALIKAMLEILLEGIVVETQNDDSVMKREELKDKVFSKAKKMVAENLGITEGTVVDKATRQLSQNTEEIKELIWDSIWNAVFYEEKPEELKKLLSESATSKHYEEDKKVIDDFFEKEFEKDISSLRVKMKGITSKAELETSLKI